MAALELLGMQTASIPPFYFASATLLPIADRHGPGYASADPYPHTVIDDFLSDGVVERILEEYPDTVADVAWTHYSAPTEQKKFAAADDEDFGPYLRHVMAQFNSAVFVKFLERLTGIRGLIVDPSFLGGGLHQIEKGGFLKVHTDFNRHTVLGLERRLNVLVYLNRDWKEEYGGHLELWNRDMTACVRRILPVASRCVVFNTTRFSYHGHPSPLTCPEGRTRKSLAFYYYTATRPADEDYGAHGTLFVKRPRERWSHAKSFLARCVPPILYDIAVKLEGKFKRSGRARGSA